MPTVLGLIVLARKADRLPGLRLRGLMIYPSGPQNAARIAEAMAALRAAGLPREIVSGGGTPQAFQSHRVPQLTEHRAGTYVFNDKMMMDTGVATPDDCALTLLTTVVSRPTSGRAIIDAGSKAFSSDGGLPMGYLLDSPSAEIHRMHEEHGYVDASPCATGLKIGEPLRVVPNYVCTAVNMHDVAYGARGDEVEVVWDIQARGKLR